jgi:hypothetical protein
MPATLACFRRSESRHWRRVAKEQAHGDSRNARDGVPYSRHEGGAGCGTTECAYYLVTAYGVMPTTLLRHNGVCLLLCCGIRSVRTTVGYGIRSVPTTLAAARGKRAGSRFAECQGRRSLQQARAWAAMKPEGGDLNLLNRAARRGREIDVGRWRVYDDTWRREGSSSLLAPFSCRVSRGNARITQVLWQRPQADGSVRARRAF